MPGQRFLGQVIGTAMKKTSKVRVERLCPLPSGKNYLVHDENEESVIGDTVAIESCPKISVRKAFKLAGIVKAARRYTDPKTGLVYTCA